DMILNGYELSPARAGVMLSTQPYYIYELALLTRRDNQEIGGWEDLGKPLPGNDRNKLKVGVLMPSSAYNYLVEKYSAMLEIIGYEGNTDAMEEVVTGKLNATIA